MCGEEKAPQKLVASFPDHTHRLHPTLNDREGGIFSRLSGESERGNMEKCGGEKNILLGLKRKMGEVEKDMLERASDKSCHVIFILTVD